MKIELSLFIGAVLSAWVLIVFILEYIDSKYFKSAKKTGHLERKKCEVCASVYFISTLHEYWRCPLCGSINKESLASQ
jgi:uncharacterized OB-fold protein